MGSSASKASKAAAGAATRKYPTRTPTATTQTPLSSAPPPHPQPKQPGPSVHPPPQASERKTQAIDLDARDPILASRLTSLGAVQPNPHYSTSSTSSLDPQRDPSSSRPPEDMYSGPLSQTSAPDPRDNPALRALEARRRIAEEAETELRDVGRKGFPGRQYVDAGTIQLALMRRKRGEADGSIEDSLGIKKGRLRLLERGIVETV